MEKTKNIKAKLLNARKEILTTKIKKEGRNAFSKYDYFTPSQITNLVTKACIDNGIITTFSIVKKDEDYIGVLVVEDLESDKHLEFSIPTAMPEIKATNITQRLGGMVTYTQRYLEQVAFSISDNNLDLDAQDNRGEKQVKKPVKTAKTKKPLTDLQFDSVIKMVEENKYTFEALELNYILDENQLQLITEFKTKQK
jgi:hypothetical protein